MSSTQRLAPLAVALLLVLAGCGAGPSDGTATESPDVNSPATADAPATPDAGDRTPAPTETEQTDGSGNETTRTSVQVRNGSLPFDANRTFARTQSLMGTDVEPPTVVVRNLSELRQTLPSVSNNPTNRALGYEEPAIDWSHPTGATAINGTVYVHPGDASAGAVERTLAHEFAHTIQFRAGQIPWLGRLRGAETLDEGQVQTAVQEGAAIYVADTYTDRYLDVENNSAFVRSLYESGQPIERTVFSLYHYGAQYVTDRVDDPANLTSVYGNHPSTTEALIHGHDPGAEPSPALTVEANGAGGNWTLRRPSTTGELNTRVTLSTELSRDRAAAAAAGWGTDRLVVGMHARNRSRMAWVWTHRWDNASEADEAFGALEEFVTQRREDSALGFQASRVDDETTAFVFGDPQFVETATVNGTNANVTVSTGS